MFGTEYRTVLRTKYSTRKIYLHEKKKKKKPSLATAPYHREWVERRIKWASAWPSFTCLNVSCVLNTQVSWKAPARHLEAIHFLTVRLRLAVGTSWADWGGEGVNLMFLSTNSLDPPGPRPWHGNLGSKQCVSQPSGRDGSLDYCSTHPVWKELSPLPSVAQVWNHKQQCQCSGAPSEDTPKWLRTPAVGFPFLAWGGPAEGSLFSGERRPPCHYHKLDCISVWSGGLPRVQKERQIIKTG